MNVPISPEELGAEEVELSPEELGAKPIKKTKTKADYIEELRSFIPLLSQVKKKATAAGIGALQGLPFVGTWTDEALGALGADREEIKKIMAENPGITTTAEVLTALAIPIPGPKKLKTLGKLVMQGIEAFSTGAGAGEGDLADRAKSGVGTAALVGAISGAGTGILKGTKKVGDVARGRRVEKEFIEKAEKEAVEKLRNPRTLLGIDDPNTIPKSVAKAQQKFEIPTQKIEEVATRYKITDNPKNLPKIYDEVSGVLDDTYKSIDRYWDEPVSGVLDDFITKFKEDARVVVGERTGPAIEASKHKLAQAKERLAEAMEAGAKPVDIAVLEDRVEKLTDELTAANIIERLRPTYKSTVKEFNELADKMEGQTSIYKLVEIKNQLFKDAKSNEAKLAIAHKFNNYLQEYVEKNIPSKYLEPWRKAKDDWKTVRLINEHLGARLTRNYKKAYPELSIQEKELSPALKVGKAMLSSGYNIRNLLMHPLSTTLGFVGKGMGRIPKVAESAGDLAEKVLQAKRIPSKGTRGLEHLIQDKERQ